MTTSTIPTGDRLAFVGVCAVCALDGRIRDDRKRSTLALDGAPVHLCCARLPDGATSCTACRVAQALEDDWMTRGKRRSNARAKQAAIIASASAAGPGA
jgi:hypothetical protein